MPNENFRRELGAEFDEMAGAPSAALPDRVRSSLAGAPEHRSPFWIAGIAAAMIAALVVGILIVGNFNRHQTSFLPAGQPTAAMPSTAPTTAPTSSAQPSPTPAFVCQSSQGSVATQSPASLISALRTGTHAGYDRVTIEFSNAAPQGAVQISGQRGTTFTLSPSGMPATLKGNNGWLLTIRGADMHTSFTGSRDIVTGYPALAEVRVIEDFEAVVQLGLGVNGDACYRAFFLTNPSRLVIDIQAAA